MLMSRSNTSYWFVPSFSMASKESRAESNLSISNLALTIFSRALRERGSSSTISTRIAALHCGVFQLGLNGRLLRGLECRQGQRRGRKLVVVSCELELGFIIV